MRASASNHLCEGLEDPARGQSDAVLASIADAFYLLDRDWRFIYVNAAAEPLLQTTREALLGRTPWEASPGVIGSPFEAPYREAMNAGKVTSAEAYFPPLGTWLARGMGGELTVACEVGRGSTFTLRLPRA